MKDKISIVLKGFVIGIANIIPGVSGGTLAITLGIYEDLLESISHIFKNFKKSMKFLIPVGSGIVLSLLLFSNIISYSLDKFPFPTSLFFVGLIVGGLPLLVNKLKESEKKSGKSTVNFLIFIIALLLILGLKFISPGDTSVDLSNLSIVGYIMVFIVGIIASASMIIPGISGSFVLMILGYYKPIIDAVSDLSGLNNLLNNMLILIPFGFGILLGIMLITKIIEKLLKKFPTATYYGIVGFILSSVITIIIDVVGYTISIPLLIIGVLLFILGFIIALKLGD
ncbi:MAG: DUF368 domain-containing protein [Bacilli bacterium]